MRIRNELTGNLEFLLLDKGPSSFTIIELGKDGFLFPFFYLKGGFQIPEP